MTAFAAWHIHSSDPELLRLVNEAASEPGGWVSWAIIGGGKHRLTLALAYDRGLLDRRIHGGGVEYRVRAQAAETGGES